MWKGGSWGGGGGRAVRGVLEGFFGGDCKNLCKGFWLESWRALEPQVKFQGNYRWGGKGI